MVPSIDSILSLARAGVRGIGACRHDFAPDLPALTLSGIIVSFIFGS